MSIPHKKNPVFFFVCVQGFDVEFIALDRLKGLLLFHYEGKLTQSAQVVIEREYNNSDNSAK